MSTAAITAASSSDITAALTQVSQIQQQLQQLQSGTLISSIDGAGESDGSDSATSATAGTSIGSTSFTDALSQAQAGDDGNTTAPIDSSALSAELTSMATADTDGTTGTGLESYPGAIDTGLISDQTTSTGGASVSGGAALPASASTLLTSSQQQFASTLSADTGLNPGVVTSWLLAEESGSAAQSRQSAGNNDWLNLGYTDSGTYGSTDSVWSDPVSAANATSGWLKGQDTIPGYGTASSGIQAILGSVGETPQAQISALQNSGWASSGYPDLPSLYGDVTSSSASRVA